MVVVRVVVRDQMSRGIDGHGEGLRMGSCSDHHVVVPTHRLQVVHQRVATDQHGHLLAQRGITGTTFVLHCLPIHSHVEALSQPTRSTLIAMRLIHYTDAVGSGLAGVLSVPANGPLEEPGTSVARVNSIMFPRAVITAHFARRVVEDPTWRGEERKKLISNCVEKELISQRSGNYLVTLYSLEFGGIRK